MLRALVKERHPMPAKTKPKPAAPSAEPKPEVVQLVEPQPTARELRRAEVNHQLEALREFAKVTDLGLIDFERLKTFKLILDRNTGSNTPIEEFITSLVDTYERRDEDGEGLTLEDIQWHLQQSITDDSNLKRAIENAHFLAARYPLPEPEKPAATA
jgi:hypothetical protein